MHQSTQVCFEDLELGDEIGPIEVPVDLQMVTNFCDIWWANPQRNRFVNLDYAQASGLPNCIVPGSMSLALISQLFTQNIHPQALKQIDLVFRQPVFHAPIKIFALVTDKRAENDENLVDCDNHLTNLEGDRLVGGKAIISLPSRSS